MRQKMICPDCGVEMNFHAEKVRHVEADATDAGESSAELIEEIHACPSCGKSDSRASRL